jgi:hypothetical protein
MAEKLKVAQLSEPEVFFVAANGRLVYQGTKRAEADHHYDTRKAKQRVLLHASRLVLDSGAVPGGAHPVTT